MVAVETSRTNFVAKKCKSILINYSKTIIVMATMMIVTTLVAKTMIRSTTYAMTKIILIILSKLYYILMPFKVIM